jgi:hypothetical protein
MDDLLSTDPIEKFRDKFVPILRLSQYFSFIDANIGKFLETDHRITTLRSRWVDFNIKMDRTLSHLDKGLSQARTFYIHNDDEFAGLGLDKKMTDAHAKLLLDSSFQVRAAKNAQKAAAQFHSAANSLETLVLPLLPQLAHDLTQYVEEYIERHLIAQKRKKYWMVPSIVLDWTIGANDPPPWHIKEVEVLPSDIQTGGALLRELPSLLEEMSAHFSRLSGLKPSDMVRLGYSSMEDLKRLYATRLTCSRFLMEMDNKAGALNDAFITGTI